jgi:cytochrome P450 family 13
MGHSVHIVFSFFQEIVSNVVVFMLAGYESTGTALSYAAHELASHPDVQRRLQEELDTELSGVGDGQSKTHWILCVVE